MKTDLYLYIILYLIIVFKYMYDKIVSIIVCNNQIVMPDKRWERGSSCLSKMEDDGRGRFLGHFRITYSTVKSINIYRVL